MSAEDQVDQVAADRERRLLNQRRFPRYYVKCACARGCFICAYTGAVSRAQAKQAAQGDASF